MTQTLRLNRSAPGKLELRVMAPLFVTVAIDMAGAGVIFPLLPFYSERFGATPEVIGLLLSSYSLCQFVSAPWIGRLSDSFGRKPVLIASQLGTFLGFILLALAHSLLWVFVARIIDGLTAGNMSVASACAVDRSTPSTRKQAIGVISAAAGIGIMVGPALSGLFSAHSTTAPVWAAAALSGMSILATTFLLPTQPKTAASTKKRPPLMSMVTRRNLPVLGLLLLFYMAFTLFMSQFALVLAARFLLHGRPLGLREIGLVFTALGSANIFVQFVLMKHLGAVLSNRMLAALSFGMLALGYAAIGSTHNLFVLGVAVLTVSFGTALTRPTLTAALTIASPQEQQGAVLGLNTSLMAGASVIGPLIGGLLIGKQLYAGWTIAIAAIALAGAVAGFAVLREETSSTTPAVLS